MDNALLNAYLSYATHRHVDNLRGMDSTRMKYVSRLATADKVEVCEMRSNLLQNLCQPVVAEAHKVSLVFVQLVSNSTVQH